MACRLSGFCRSGFCSGDSVTMLRLPRIVASSVMSHPMSMTPHTHCQVQRFSSCLQRTLPSSKPRLQLAPSGGACGCQRSKTRMPEMIRKEKPAGAGKGPINWKTMVVTLAAGTTLLGGMLYVRKEKERRLELKKTKSLGKAAIGGAFDLIDHTGKPRKSSDFLGQWMMIYFGFTHCPDICPDELEKLVEAVNAIDSQNDLPNLVPVLITVDPSRDTVQAVADYVKDFSPKLIGLTGPVDKVKEACRAYRVYFSSGPKDEDDDYIVDHTVIMYLVNPDGDFVDYFGQNKKADEIVNGVAMQMLQYQKKK